MSKKKVLVTGGAGFIGSNLVEALLKNDEFSEIRILDNLSTGFLKNIQPFLSNNKVQFIEADIRDIDICMEATKGVDLVCHQAALGSVPRSIEDPLTTNAVNISGTLNIFHASVQNGVKKVVYAASSSTYGDSQQLPKKEGNEGNPLSPYAVTKLVNEIYADVFYKTYGLKSIGLRYFNIFGPKQNPKGAYAAVIPIFINNIQQGNKVYINGDGETSRDFTYVANAVQANIKALLKDEKELSGAEVVNIACDDRTTLKELVAKIASVENKEVTLEHRNERVGDVKHSWADISKAKELLGYNPEVKINEGIELVYNWYKSENGF